MACLSRCLFLLTWSILHIPSPASANTEKVIFVAPDQIELPQDGPSIESLQIATLSPSVTTYRAALPVVFANASYPKGLQSWYALQNLAPGSRYEVRICWAATQPTTWDLDVFTLKQTMEQPELIQSLATFAEVNSMSSRAQDNINGRRTLVSPQSLLFLRVSGAADYFTLKHELMARPDPVVVDLVLDQFVLNIFPRSLTFTAMYIVCIAIAGWYGSNTIWRWLLKGVEEHKQHSD